jgi:16S rRNA (guanine527-N7)-methyltransferase
MMAAGGLPPLGAAGFAATFAVSRETMERLGSYLALLERWQKAINLVGRSTLDDPWRRHVLDSAQLARFLPERQGGVADLGSGAGLPGIILAIMGTPNVHLVEADRRKAQFLREAARHLGLANVTVHRARIETLAMTVGAVTSRALAPLPALLRLAAPLLAPGGRLVLLKGRNVETELAEAEHAWAMRTALHPSLADPEGRILILDEVRSRET